MLFTSAIFLFIYLPIVWGGYYALCRHFQIGAAAWLFFSSVIFYGYWVPEFTALLLGSIGWNFFVGRRIGKSRAEENISAQRNRAKYWLIAGIAVDLAVLGYFKYAGFFLSSIEYLIGRHWNSCEIILPVGISFFTFTQIAFLADVYQKGVREYHFIPFGLFVTYFPHLVAGPVLHHARMMPQFKDASTYRLNLANVSAGLSIFALGLFKKIILADSISPYADAVFDGALNGQEPDFVEAWIGALAYTFQLYFDFSGYSDMAVGLSWMFNVRLPFNFDSPYKALNISGFWKRWHMTLSAFLRDYLYIPLGGNRKGRARRYVNLAATMLLGGLWHGASWTFVFWGGLHGIYLALNHAFQALPGRFVARLRAGIPFRMLAWLVTFLCVVVAWVFFRAADFASASSILSAMATPDGLSGIHPLFWNQGLAPARAVKLLAIFSGIVFFLPNSNQFGLATLDFCRNTARAVPVILGMALVASVFLVLINSTRDSVSAFIYFNF